MSSQTLDVWVAYDLENRKLAHGFSEEETLAKLAAEQFEAKKLDAKTLIAIFSRSIRIERIVVGLKELVK